MIRLSEIIKDVFVKNKKTGRKYDVKKFNQNKHDMTWDYRGSKENPNPFASKGRKPKAELPEDICFRMDGESDEDFVQRCGNKLTREPDYYNDRETSHIKLQKLIAKKKLPKDMKWNQGFTLETNEEMPGGAFVGLTSPQGYINGSPSVKKKKKKQEEDIVNDNEIDREDILLHKLVKSVIKGKQKGKVLEGDINKPSPKLRPEPHPTRHETEHPPYEKDAMKKKGKYTPPSLKEESKQELELQRMKLYNKAFKMFPNSPKQLKVQKEIDAINQKLKAFHKKK